MSWLARSIANSLRIDGDDPPPAPENLGWPGAHPENEGGVDRQAGVKDDLTEFRETLTRQLQGVASFLAPPPADHRVFSELSRTESPAPSISGDGEDDDDSSVYARISIAPSDHSEIGGLFQGMNRRSLDSRTVSENYEACASFHRFGSQNVDYADDEEDDDGGDDEDWMNQAAGLTDEVLTFAGNIAHHPETWLDFPIEDEEDLDDFPMSESQKKHGQAVEHLTPRLAALRIELCPAHMSVGFFWKVYFVLLHSRLNKQDAEVLSTPEVVEARAKWMQELQKRAKKESEPQYTGHFSRQSADLDEDFTPTSLQNEHSETFSSWTFASEPATSSTTADADSDTEEIKYTNKSIKPLAETSDKNVVVAPVSKRVVLNFDDDDDDDWPEDDCLGHDITVIPVGIEEEVSFSDLEDDDCCIPVKSKPDARV